MNTEKAYLIAKEMYSEIGVDTDAVMKKLENIKISPQC
ncbi:MAG TPA: hypothetical protein DDZ99_02430 [Clostridiales bacterium]|nr:hypothetical protein [Clostridiales bacterium]